MTKHLGLNEQLDVSMASGAYVAVDTIHGLHFNVGGVESDYNFSDYMVPNVVVNNVGLSIDTTAAIKVNEHQVPLPFGKVLRIGLDNVIIPMIDSSAYDLASLLQNNIDCQGVGQAIADNVPFGSQATWAGLCDSGLVFGANAIYNKMAAIDANALTWDITGTAKGVATNNDKRVDTIQGGKWTGTLSYAGTPAPLAAAVFSGTRM
jgi:hypothetical protein